MNSTAQDYTTISPSAKALMHFKAYTSIPFAKQTTEALFPEDDNKKYNIEDFGFWASVVHFENRYYSINELVSEVSSPNILELSSGYNFRGLELTLSNPGLHYVDTDLPGIIWNKKIIASSFSHALPKGKLIYEALNALDNTEFQRLVETFDPQPVTIVNEGLFLYLSLEEKKRLCQIIRTQLEEKGGYWVTSDIYINHDPGKVGSDRDRSWSNFFSRQEVDQKMFGTFEEAEEFFFQNGFLLDKEYSPDYSKLSSAAELLKVASPEQLKKLREGGKVQASWRLKLKNKN